MALMNLSATDSTTNASFSSVQMMLLSSDAPSTTLRAAFSMSAVSSTTTGGLPGPAQIARLPLLIAASTTPGPPVTTKSRTPGCLISACADSIVGSSIAVTRLGGPPACVMASLSSTMLRIETRLAMGCTLKTTVLPAANMPIVLQMMVDVGFVLGVIEAMTPKGARSISIRP